MARAGGLAAGEDAYNFIPMADHELQCQVVKGHNLDPSTMFIGANRVAYCLY